MKLLWWLLLSGTVLACCPAARSDSIPAGDPEVIMAGGKGSLPVGSIFSFVSPTGTSPITLFGGSPCVVGLIAVLDCVFQNASGSTWSSLTFDISPSGQIPPFTCLSLAYFTNCTFNSTGNQVTFSGGPGIGVRQDFTVEVLLWFPETQFSGKAQPDPPADPTPEPPIADLFLIGFAALLARQRLWQGRSSRTSFSSR
jgi:hypothetical protein